LRVLATLPNSICNLIIKKNLSLDGIPLATLPDSFVDKIKVGKCIIYTDNIIDKELQTIFSNIKS